MNLDLKNYMVSNLKPQPKINSLYKVYCSPYRGITTREDTGISFQSLEKAMQHIITLTYENSNTGDIYYILRNEYSYYADGGGSGFNKYGFNKVSSHILTELLKRSKITTIKSSELSKKLEREIARRVI